MNDNEVYKAKDLNRKQLLTQMDISNLEEVALLRYEENEIEDQRYKNVNFRILKFFNNFQIAKEY